MFEEKHVGIVHDARKVIECERSGAGTKPDAAPAGNYLVMLLKPEGTFKQQTMLWTR